MFLNLNECRNKETIHIIYPIIKYLMKARKLWEVNQKGLLHHTNVQWCRFISPSWSRQGNPTKRNYTKINCRKGLITPMCTGAGSFLLLGPGGENQSNRIAEKEISHQRALVQGYFSYLDQVEENQSKIKCRKGNLSTSHNGSAFTQTGMHVLKIKSHLTM